MHRERPDYVKRMLQAPLARETLSLVRRCNISDDKWKIFRLAEGGVWRRLKQKEIAAQYDISAARVSMIVRDVRERLIRAVKEPDAADMVRAYRRLRYAELKNRLVDNAGTVRDITKLFSSDRYDKRHADVHLGWDYKVDFVAAGERLSITGRSRLSDSRGDSEPTGYRSAYTIFWAVKANSPTEVPAMSLFGNGSADSICHRAVRRSLLLIDFNEMFWVVAGRSILLGEKRLVINLEPAEYKSETARLAIPGGSR